MFERSQQYGSSYESEGVLGALVQLIGCVGRLRNIALDQAVADWDLDKLRDLLLDTHNYSLITLACLAADNLRGQLDESWEVELCRFP
jgi:hypothetical protein